MKDRPTSRQLTAPFDLITTFAHAVNHYVKMIHNWHCPTYHLQPAVPAVYTSILPNASPARLVGGMAGGSVEPSVIPLINLTYWPFKLHVSLKCVTSKRWICLV